MLGFQVLSEKSIVSLSLSLLATQCLAFVTSYSSALDETQPVVKGLLVTCRARAIIIVMMKMYARIVTTLPMLKGWPLWQEAYSFNEPDSQVFVATTKLLSSIRVFNYLCQNVAASANSLLGIPAEHNIINSLLGIPAEHNSINSLLGIPAEHNSINPLLGIPAEHNSINSLLGIPAEHNSINPLLGIPAEHKSINSLLGIPAEHNSINSLLGIPAEHKSINSLLGIPA